MIKDLAKIITIGLIGLNCSSGDYFYTEDEKFLRIKFREEPAYLYLNPKGKNEYILHFYKNTEIENNLDVYLAKFVKNPDYSNIGNEDTLSVIPTPYFKLIDSNGDFDADLLLYRKMGKRYDTLKLSYKNTINLNKTSDIIKFFRHRNLQR